MKKLITLFSVLLFAVAFAQISYGVKAGYSNSTLDWNNSPPNSFWEKYSDFYTKSFFYVGGFAEYKFNHNYAVQGELIFTQTGGKSHVDLYQLVGTEVVSMGYVDEKFRYTQIQIPLAAKYYFVDKFAISGGLNFAINIATNVNDGINYDLLPTSKFENVKTLNLFPFLGAEYHITPKIFADARYNFGISNILKDEIDMRSRFLQVGFGYKF